MRTIWSPSVQRRIAPQDRHLVLYITPLIYGVNALSYLVFGTVNGGSKVMREVLGEWGTFGLSSGIGVTSALALVGLVTVNHQLERWSALAMGAAIMAYAVLLFFALGHGQSPVVALTGVVLTSVLLWSRLRLISKDIARAKAAA